MLPARTREVKRYVNKEMKSDVNNPLSRRRSCLFDYVVVSLYILNPTHTGSVSSVYYLLLLFMFGTLRTSRFGNGLSETGLVPKTLGSLIMTSYE